MVLVVLRWQLHREENEMMTRRLLSWAVLVPFVALPGCFQKSDEASGKSSTKSGASLSQSTGTLEGTVTISGDPPLMMDADSQKIPRDCDVARTLYPPLFREGPGRTLADVFVGVTGYKGKAAEKTEPLAIDAKGCAFPSRTFGLTTRQHLTVRSADHRAYIPNLFGAKGKSTLVAVPNGSPIPVFHKGPGQYALVNDMQIFMQAAVLVVDYSTFDVTKLDGKFKIEGIPVGPVDLSAFLPAAQLTATRKVEVRAGESTHVDLKLTFDAAAFKAARQPKNLSSVQSAPQTP